MPDLTYQHVTRVNRVPEGTMSLEILDQTLAGNLNGPPAAAICSKLHLADVSSLAIDLIDSTVLVPGADG